MSIRFLAFFVIALPLAAPGGMIEGGSIRGKLVLVPPGEIAGATVLLEDTKLGTSTDSTGSFLIEQIPPGTYSIIARLIGYDQIEIPEVTVRSGSEETVVLKLRQSAVQMRVVEVTASRRQPVEDTRTSVTSMMPREAKYMPGAAEDVLRSLHAVPGVLSSSDFSSQLVIRGSGPDQNLMRLDGFEILNPYRLYGFISMFNPETVNSISLMTGGFPARYGDRLSAVLDVHNRDGRREAGFAGKINSSITNANVILEGALPFEGSWILSARRTYYDLVVEPFLKATKMVEGDVALPNFRDVQFRGTFPVSPEHRLSIDAVTSRDGAHLVSGPERQQPDSVSVFDQSYNTLYGLTYQYSPGQAIVAQTLLSWYRNDGNGTFDGTFVDPAQDNGELTRADTLGIRFFSLGVDFDFRYTKASGEEVVVWNSGRHEVEVGGGVDALTTDRIRYFRYDDAFRAFVTSRGFALPENTVATVSYRRFNGYAQDRIRIGNDLYVQPGLRFDSYSMLRGSYVSPRFNASLALDDITNVRAAYGMYFQSPGMDKEDNRSALDFTADSFRRLKAERADHYVLGVDRMVDNEWQIKIEGYDKRFTSLVVPEKLVATRWTSSLTGDDPYQRGSWSTPVRIPGDSLTAIPVNDASGTAYGFEVTLAKLQTVSTDRLNGWISYALSFANRERDGILTPFIFDQRHAMNIVANWRFAERWELGVNFALRSGRPYARAIGVQPRVVMERFDGRDSAVVQIDTHGKVVLDVAYEQDAYTGRLSLYHSLDLRLTTYPRWWDLDWAVYLDVTNVYNHQNEQQVTAYIDEKGHMVLRRIYGLPIFPAIGMSLAF